MPSQRALRNKGKTALSRYFQTFKEGQHVALIKERGTVAHFPFRMQGRTGVVIGKRGFSYVVAVKDLNLMKHIIVHPLNLKRVITA